jgi:hypothetical protein
MKAYANKVVHGRRRERWRVDIPLDFGTTTERGEQAIVEADEGCTVYRCPCMWSVVSASCDDPTIVVERVSNRP